MRRRQIMELPIYLICTLFIIVFYCKLVLLDLNEFYNDNACGNNLQILRQPRYNGNSRIIHGRQSIKGAWPWQVSLQLFHPHFGFIGHWCGAVLISTEWVLTAAHCIKNDYFNLPIPSMWQAILGDWNQRIKEKSEAKFDIKEIVVHERFHNFHHDIALIKISQEMDQTTKKYILNPICLPRKKFIHNMTDHCVVTGWGTDNANNEGNSNGHLLEATIPLHNNTVCAMKYGGSVTIRKGHLCGGNLDGSTGTCVGDSGGPLQCLLKDGRWVLVGITSFGSGCAKPGFPDVYTRLSHYLPWIRAKTRL